MNISLITPARGSKSGSLLARQYGWQKLNGQRLAKFVGFPDRVVINWGNSALSPKVMECRVINKPEAVGKAVNKLTAFKTMSNEVVSIPPFTESEFVARQWVNQGHSVVARHTLTGSGGDGIQILSDLKHFPCEAPLYTLYIPKQSEFRCHVMGDRVFDIQRKMRRRDHPDDKVNWKIRNHNNGFIFGRNGGPIEPNLCEKLLSQSRGAIKALGLDFGAVDLIHNAKDDIVYVLEVNTAPGMEGETVFNYGDALMHMLDNDRPGRAKLPKALPPNNLMLEDVLQKFAVNRAK